MTGFHGTRVRADLFAGWFGRGGSRPGSLPVLGTAPQGKENIPVNTRDKARNPLAVRYLSGGVRGRVLRPRPWLDRSSNQFLWPPSPPRPAGLTGRSRVQRPAKRQVLAKTRQETLGSGPADSGPHAHAIGDQGH